MTPERRKGPEEVESQTIGFSCVQTKSGSILLTFGSHKGLTSHCNPSVWYMRMSRLIRCFARRLFFECERLYLTVE